MYASLREETTCTAVVMGGGGGRGEGVGGGGEGGGRGRRGGYSENAKRSSSRMRSLP